MISSSAPTIGAYLRQPGVGEAVEARRAAARWRVRRDLDDRVARARLGAVLLDPFGVLILNVFESIRTGRRLDVIADELRDLADRCDALQVEQDRELESAIRSAVAA